ncbi:MULTISPECIES: LytR/AlgR family response regulator transcription factor [Pseudoalteromonas]|uniref:LytTR family DNA-binding domain-containing protein n=1 Tax=Pseudoalteromonas obscura TaxID=3048491 RepID=A0ABT7EHK8_9GAMM|nr:MULTISPECIES: LytTR family DNA-binding domain-containing protein [Pseudoalteromonas]MBQ4836191.1 response regulator transcription factor [Pseudoalteromonas luteoviolacea]MDK2594540.1 LytTR family DNA-binding domain-containing protein [Pseudoalteromonas sp. P94(2023)]
MKYLVVDDEPIARRRIQRLLGEFEVLKFVGEAQDGQQAIELVEELEPELVFLDISMPGMDGIELGKILRNKNANLKLVYVTAYPEHALQAYQIYASGYLVKPVDSAQISELLNHLFPDTLAKLQYQVGHDIRWVNVPDILIAQTDDRYTHIYFEGGDALIDTPLKKLLSDYPHHFVQVHRNTIVKKASIIKLESCEGAHRVVLQGVEEPVQVSRRAYASLKSVF